MLLLSVLMNVTYSSTTELSIPTPSSLSQPNTAQICQQCSTNSAGGSYTESPVANVNSSKESKEKVLGSTTKTKYSIRLDIF